MRLCFFNDATVTFIHKINECIVNLRHLIPIEFVATTFNDSSTKKNNINQQGGILNVLIFLVFYEIMIVIHHITGLVQ